VSGLPRPRVLLADDYAGILTALQRLLKPDCEVVGCVADGAALLDAANRLHPDVIVADLNMPEVSGLEACRRIKQTRSDVEIIVLTADEDACIEQVALGLGAFALVAKSKVGDCLLPAIYQACSRRLVPVRPEPSRL
jgi:CheY-like chemotaxis protein